MPPRPPPGQLDPASLIPSQLVLAQLVLIQLVLAQLIPRVASHRSRASWMRVTPRGPTARRVLTRHRVLAGCRTATARP
ncbi:MAG TPA: hypothetical protein VK586_05025 [Streptosporangiaceae bacterium]|nr:hypothetical protein [Streptosporangiaceae bacterium]